MKTGLTKFIRYNVIRGLKIFRPDKSYSQNEGTDELISILISVVRSFKDILYIVIGIISAGFGLKGFLLPNSFIDGGVTGISLLTAAVSGLPLSILIFTINLPFIALGFSQINRTFAIKSIFAITGLAIAIAVIDYPVITSDKLLVAAFGGFFLGAGIGLSIRGGGVLDGTEILAIYLSKKVGFSIGDIILVFNIIIFLIAAYLLSIETALYAILTYIAASKTVDFVVEGIEEYTGVTIVSEKSEDIRMMLTMKIGSGVTIYDGKRGFGKRGESLNHVDIIYTVITRLEVTKMQAEVQRIDPNAFIVLSTVKDTKGGMLKKRSLDEEVENGDNVDNVNNGDNVDNGENT